MKIALRVEVSTLRGLAQGVPALVAALKHYGAGATFFFNVGPDRSGQALRALLARDPQDRKPRLWRAGQYGARALLSGTLLPAPDLGRRSSDIMCSVRDAGFEVGLLGFDHALWHKQAVQADAAWTRLNMERAVARYAEIFGEPPHAHAAPGWQMNIHAWRLTQRFGFHYSSASRGGCPYIPLYRAEIVACPQVPTTLPTLDEMIGRNGMSSDAAVAELVQATPASAAGDQVFTLRAEFEGGRLMPQFASLLAAWHAAGAQFVTLRDLLECLDRKTLPRHEVIAGRVRGNAHALALQGKEFLAGCAAAPLRV